MKTISLLCFAYVITASPVFGENDTSRDKAADLVEEAIDRTAKVSRAILDKSKEAGAALVDAGTADPDARKVDVILTEHRIAMQQDLARGKTAFVVRNMGTEKHSFQIAEEGSETKFGTSVAPGQTKVLHVDLRPGSYTAYCPHNDHGETGMTLQLNVK